jgi:hypothetical protein
MLSPASSSSRRQQAVNPVRTRRDQRPMWYTAGVCHKCCMGIHARADSRAGSVR